jgi:membrane protease YdiL (CAAX protease family)
MGAERVRFAVIVYAALAALATLGCAIADRSAWHLERTSGPSRAVSIPVALAIGAATGLASVALSRALAQRTRWGRSLTHELAQALLGLERRAVLWLAIASASGEELLFRGAVQAGLVDHGGAVQGVAIASAIFGLMHLPANRRLVPWTIMATAMGVVFGLLYLWTGEIVAPLAAHAIINYCNLHFLLDRSAVASDARDDDRRALPGSPGVGR